jgi:uncharacterized protein
VAYGVEVTPHRLARVERAEAAIRRLLGDRVANLRVRDLGDRASIEVDRELLPLADEGALVDAVRGAGFADAVVDPQGFRSGSMNERLAPPPRNPARSALRADAARFRGDPEES